MSLGKSMKTGMKMKLSLLVLAMVVSIPSQVYALSIPGLSSNVVTAGAGAGVGVGVGMGVVVKSSGPGLPFADFATRSQKNDELANGLRYPHTYSTYPITADTDTRSNNNTNSNGGGGGDNTDDPPDSDSEGNLTETPPNASYSRRLIAIVVFLGGLLILTASYTIYHPSKPLTFIPSTSTFAFAIPSPSYLSQSLSKLKTHLPHPPSTLLQFFPHSLTLPTLPTLHLPFTSHHHQRSQRGRGNRYRRRRNTTGFPFRVSENTLIQWAQEDGEAEEEEYDLMVNGDGEYDFVDAERLGGGGGGGGVGVVLVDESVPLSATGKGSLGSVGLDGGLQVKGYGSV